MRNAREVVPLVTAITLVAAAVPAHAVSIDCSGTKRSKAAPYQEAIKPGDRPDHELQLAIRVHTISSKHPDFNGSEQTVYALQDAYDKSGTSVGYFMYTLSNGDKVWARFDSIYATVTAEGSWEVTYQGVLRFVNGTGKYANIRGGGHYEGRIRPGTGFEETFTCSAEY